MNERFDLFRAYLRTATGVSLEQDQRPATDQRLAPIAIRFGLATVDDLIDRVLLRREPQATAAVIDAMMTSETFFFRDRKPFEDFRTLVLPRLLDSRKDHRRIRIWSSACATGQEPYSIAMILDEAAAQLEGWDVDILASDLSASALETARGGLYNQFEMQRGLPIALLLRHFRQEQDKWRIGDHLRTRIRFNQINLVEDFSRFGPFDVIFCRNVLMYFDPAIRKAVLGRLAQALEPDGLLVLGATEFIAGGSPFTPLPESLGLLQLRDRSSHAERNRLATA